MTLLISIADSHKQFVSGAKNKPVLSESGFPPFFGQFMYNVPKFNDCEIIVQYIQCPQQTDSHSCGLYTILSAFSLAKYNSTLALDNDYITNNIQVIKQKLSYLIEDKINDVEVSDGILNLCRFFK